MSYYMYCPLDLTVRQQHIYTLLYRQSKFKENFRVRYTVEQLTLDSDVCFQLTEKMVSTILKQLIKSNHLKLIERGVKGKPSVYEIHVDCVINGNLSVTNRELIGNLSVTNESVIPTVSEIASNLSVTNVYPIGKQLVNPIIEYKEKDIKEVSSYQELFNYYVSKDLIKHKALTIDMKKAIDLAKKELKLNDDYMKRIIDRHLEKVEATKDNGQYATKLRPLAELFGQKKKNSVSLICSDYLDEIYTKPKAFDDSNRLKGATGSPNPTKRAEPW